MSGDTARPLRIGYLIDSLVTGGAERLVASFAEAAVNRPEFDLTVFTLSNADTPFRAQIEATGTRVVCLPGRSLVDPMRLLRLERALARHDIEVLHAHLSASMILGAAAAAARRIPFFATVHNVKPSTRRVGGLRQKLYDFALSHPRTTRMAVGEQVAATARQECPGDFVVVPNAVPPSVVWRKDDKRAARQEMGFDDGDVGMLAVGLIIGQKGYPDLIEAFSRVAAEDPRAKLAIIGAVGWQDLMSNLAEQVQAYGLQDRVRFLGLREDVARLLAASDLFVSASHWEGAPVSLLEAMANGCPCLVTDVGDNARTLQGTGAPVLPAQDITGIAGEMSRLLNAPDTRAEIGDAVKQRVADEFGTDLWLDRLMSIYKSRRTRGEIGIRGPEDGTSRMRIAMVITSFHPIVGGAEKQVAQLSQRLLDAGHDVHIVTRRWPGLAARDVIDGITVHRVGGGGPKAVAAAAFTLLAVARLWKLRPDVIHCHSLFTPAIAAALAKRLLKIPAVAKPMCSGEALSISAKRFGRTRLAIFGRTIDRFVAVSGEIERELVSLDIPGDGIHRIPNGVDLKKFRPPDPTERDDIWARLALPEGPLFLFAGRIATQKRLPMLLEQWPRVLASAPDAKLLVAGANRKTSRSKSADGADDGVPDHLLKQPGVHLLGHVDDMATLYRAVDVFVLPSDREGLSNAMLEACASGLPTVAAAIGGAEDFVVHGQNGYLYDVDCIEQLGDAMIELASDPVQRTRVGDAARQTVAAHYDINATMNGLIAQYQDLIAPPKQHSVAAKRVVSQ